MGRTERRFLVAAAIVFLLAASVASGTAAPTAFDGASESEQSSLSASPVTFAERITAGNARTAGGREAGSWQDAIELIALAGICAIAVAFYSAATAQRTDTRVPVRVRRR
jgi:hypothetical protein